MGGKFFLAGAMILSACLVFPPGTRENVRERSPEAQFDVCLIPDPGKRLSEYEKLTYEVRWLGIPVATLTSSVKGIVNYRGKPAYRLEASIKSNAYLSAIYRIDDRFVSYMDVEKLRSLRHEVYRKEGRHRKEAVTVFDQVRHKAYFRNITDGTTKIFSIPHCVQDTLTATYFFKFFSLKVGKRLEYAVCNNEKNYQIFARVESRALVNLPGKGRQEALRVQPYAKFNGERVRKGNMRLYYSVDGQTIPLYGTLSGPLFTRLTLTLRKIEGS